MVLMANKNMKIYSRKTLNTNNQLVTTTTRCNSNTIKVRQHMKVWNAQKLDTTKIKYRITKTGYVKIVMVLIFLGEPTAISAKMKNPKNRKSYSQWNINLARAEKLWTQTNLMPIMKTISKILKAIMWVPLNPKTVMIKINWNLWPMMRSLSKCKEKRKNKFRERYQILLLKLRRMKLIKVWLICIFV